MEQNVAATPEIVDNEMKSPLPNEEDLVPSPIVDATEIITETLNEIKDDAAAEGATKVEEIVCELNQDDPNVQELITDAIQDITSDDNKTNQEPCELSEEAKLLSQQITNIANEINEITDNVNIADNHIHDLGDKLVETSNNLLECTTTVATEQLNDFIQETEAKSPGPINTSAVESEVAPSEIMNSFLDRSVIPEVTSPLSPPEKFEQERPELWKCEFPLPSQYDIKCETIQPEFPVHTIASPSEESKGNDTPPPTPSNVIEEPELKQGSPEPQKIVEAVEKLSEPPLPVDNKESVPVVEAAVAAAATAATVVGTAAAINKTSAKPKVGSTTATAATAKKVPSKTSPTSPSKTLTSKPSTTTTKRTTTTTAPKISTTTTAKLTPAKPKTTTTPTPSPKPISRTTAAPKPKTPTITSKLSTDKKPLTNGDAKAPIRQPLLKKTTVTTSTVGAKPTTTTATSKVSLTKTSTTATKPLANGTAKPALSATKTTARPSLTSSAGPKARPATLTSKSTTATTATKAAPIKSSSTTATKPGTTAAAKPKPTAAAAPRPRMVLTTKTAAKTPDTEKQIKETANKQISASRTSTTRTSSTTTRTSTTTLKKAAPLTNRTSTTTRTTTVKSSATGKKPTEVTRTTITKTKSSPIKPNVEQNGVVNVIQEITTVSVVSENDDSQQLQLVKDNSPVDAIPPIVDNSQLPPPMEIIAD